MRGLRAVFLGAALLAASVAGATEKVLPPSTNDGFTSFRDGVEVGAAGKQIKDANVDIRKDHVVLHLTLESGQPADLMLTRRTRETRGPSSNYFAIESGSQASGLDLKPVEKLLNVAFPSDPWVTVAGGPVLPRPLPATR